MATNISERTVTDHPKQVPAEFVPPSVWRNPWHFLAFGFGTGTIAKAPGTWGSLAAVPVSYTHLTLPTILLV